MSADRFLPYLQSEPPLNSRKLVSIGRAEKLGRKIERTRCVECGHAILDPGEYCPRSLSGEHVWPHADEVSA